MENKQEQIKQTIIKIYSQFEQRNQQNENISEITYYKQFDFESARLEEKDIYVVKIEKNEGKEKQETYEIYKSDELIATVNAEGKIHFLPEYLEQLKQVDEKYFEQLNIKDAKFDLTEDKKE